ncbi:hypothetical protein JJB07_07520 [Tumebacillus sp. ITR2]|uniref:Methylamine utilisation protein MauE domain-containing protein n=1 Tax=Tumebacillus amylolyticus TaxID=2801339 RepID=A0ABS1J8V4_9BACL|nr:MauE/DoxX family redox-associated membrane protein [Tumebacillus amylolyticus]MBL0386494.1 hypothetical protein [Tumebacillus amylolyticus]
MTDNATHRSTANFSPAPSKSRGLWYWFILAVQVVLGGIFLYSAVTKILDVYSFGLVLKSYDLLPEGLIKPLAVTLPLVEFVLGAAMLFKPTAFWAGLGIGLLSLLFTGVMISKWGTIMPYGCGCFGPTEATPVGIVDVGKDVLLVLGAALVVYALKKSTRSQ